jgi:hypothetical protein
MKFTREISEIHREFIFTERSRFTGRSNSQGDQEVREKGPPGLLISL